MNKLWRDKKIKATLRSKEQKQICGRVHLTGKLKLAHPFTMVNS